VFEIGSPCGEPVEGASLMLSFFVAIIDTADGVWGEGLISNLLAILPRPAIADKPP
jgi:hypothetical protein